MLVTGLLVASVPSWTTSGGQATSRFSDRVDIAVPGEVYEVRTLGAWRDGSRAGTYRIVTLRGGFDHIQTVVMIQWMEQGLDQGAPSVVAARRVELLDDLGPIAVLAVRETTVPDGLNLSIQVRNTVTGEEGDVEAVAGPPGQLTATYTPAGRR